jgi:hypothetical protein
MKNLRQPHKSGYYGYRLLHTLNGDMEVFFVLPCSVSDHAGVLSLVGQSGVLDAEYMTVAMGTIL